MGKFSTRVYRKDGTDDHVHALPDGTLTSGALSKPSKDRYDMHTHLYECDERVVESSPAHNFGDHVHETEYGVTSGPLPVGKKPGDPWQDQTDKTA